MKHKFKIVYLLLITLLIGLVTYTSAHAADKEVKEEGEVEITGTGTIGIEDVAYLDKFIDVTLTSEFAWVVTEKHYPNITSVEHMIKNNSQEVDLKVTVTDFAENGRSGIENDKLTLNFTDDLREDDLGADILKLKDNDRAYNQLLLGGSEWTYSFDGSYDGKVPASKLVAKYTMNIRLSVENYYGSATISD